MSGDHVMRIDAEGSPDAVHRLVWKKVAQVLALRED
jgi:hypothetical protein